MIHAEWYTFIAFFAIVILQAHVKSLHISGTWKGESSFIFLSKFGFQQTDRSDVENTQGFIYGNITGHESQNDHSGIPYTATLVVVDSEYFMEFYGNRSHDLDKQSCISMFRKIDTMAFNRYCKTNGREDFLRTVPCPKNGLCVEEDRPGNVINGYQFTYHIQDNTQPRFWYISLVACHHDYTNHTHCTWQPTPKQHIHIDYDIWFVNGNPALNHQNPFEHQFSFEEHDVFEIYLIFILFYTFLIPIWLYFSSRQNQSNRLTWLLATCMLIEASGILLNLLHVIIFSVNGHGVALIRITGDYLSVISESLLVLLLLMLAKGWMINRDLLRRKWMLAVGWTLFTLLNIAVFSFYTASGREPMLEDTRFVQTCKDLQPSSSTEKALVPTDDTDISLTPNLDIHLVKSTSDPHYTILNLDLWQTAPGYTMLAVRMVFMLWFLAELRSSTIRESNFTILHNFLHFGAFYLAWFIYLPILVIVETQLSALWKFKVGLSVCYSADLLAYAILVHLLWPSRTILYLKRPEDPVSTYDLEASGLLSMPDLFRVDPPDSGLETPGRHTPEFTGSLRLIDDPNVTSSSESAPATTIKGHNYALLNSMDLSISDEEL